MNIDGLFNWLFNGLFIYFESYDIQQHKITCAD